MKQLQHPGRWAVLISLGSHALLLWCWQQGDGRAQQRSLPLDGGALPRLQVRLLPRQAQNTPAPAQVSAVVPRASLPRPQRRPVVANRSLSVAAASTVSAPVPQATPAEQAPASLDVEALRAGLREDMRRARPQAASPLLKSPEEPSLRPREAALATAIQKTARPDCRNAYVDAGLLAVFPLLKDAVTGSGCKW